MTFLSGIEYARLRSLAESSKPVTQVTSFALNVVRWIDNGQMSVSEAMAYWTERN